MESERSARAAKIKGVYLITDHGDRLEERVASAIRGGVSVVQFRSKNHDSGDKLRLGKALQALCQESGTPFIINDDIALAGELSADGVHLGQDDGNPSEARRILGANAIIGISTHSLQEALDAQNAGADYIGFGAIYPTASKQITSLADTDQLASIRNHISIPIVAVGGICRDNGRAIIEAGADSIAVISAVMGAHEPCLAAAELKLLFNCRKSLPRGNVLTIAGSDSGGGAGIQADLKTIALLGGYGASVLTALTAQNTCGVSRIFPCPPDFVSDQIDAVLSDIPIDVVKTGMLFSADNIRIVAQKLASFQKRIVVVDPVMIAKGGASLVDETALQTLREQLLPRTYLLTPNIPEAEALTGYPIESETEMEKAARTLHSQGARNVLLKGGHLAGENAVDLLFDGRQTYLFSAPHQDTANTHGTGCTLASAIATLLACGYPLIEAVTVAKKFICSAIAQASPLGSGHGPVNHTAAAFELGFLTEMMKKETCHA